MTDQNLYQLETIKNREDFVRLNAQARKWVSSTIILQALHRPGLSADVLRAGFTVTKKTEPSAVKRNRIKRRLRAAAREIFPAHARSQHDYCLIGRKQDQEAPFDALKKDLAWCLKKLDCYRNDQEGEHA